MRADAASGRTRWKARLARALGLDGNPLRRASDRAEAWIRAGLLVVFLTAGPLAALAAGQWAAHAAAARTSAQPHTAQAPQLGESASAGVVAAVVTLAVAALALLIAARIIRRLLDSRRLAAWEKAWREIGPRWTGRRP